MVSELSAKDYAMESGMFLPNSKNEFWNAEIIQTLPQAFVVEAKEFKNALENMLFNFFDWTFPVEKLLAYFSSGQCSNKQRLLF